jgi:hypothetical protein
MLPVWQAQVERLVLLFPRMQPEPGLRQAQPDQLTNDSSCSLSIGLLQPETFIHNKHDNADHYQDNRKYALRELLCLPER